MANILEESAEGLDKFLDNLGNVTDTYISLEGIIPRVTDLFLNQSAEIRKLNKELGNGSKLSSELKGSFAQLSKTIGVATRDILELVSATKDYHQGIKDSTEYSLKFIKASGVSSDVVGKLSARLNILGNVSEKTFDAMYTNVLSVRDAYGLTSEQMEDVLTLVDKYAVLTQASNEQIERGTTLLAKFTSQLTSAGMEAGRVADLLHSMIDPDQLTDNIALMSKLGISVSDMVSGDPISKLEGSAEKLKELGQEIANIAKNNRYQANEVAKVYGITLEEATLLSNLDTSERALDTQKKLDEYRNEMATFANSIEALKNTIGGAISGPLSFVAGILEKFGNTLGLLPKGLAGLFGVWLGKKLINKLSDGLENVMGRAARKFSQEMGKYLGATQSRFGEKTTDIGRLAPKQTKQTEKLGFGYNFLAKQEEIERRRNAAIKIKKGDLSIGESYEILQDQLKELRSKKRMIDSVPDGARKDYLNKRYAGIDQAIKDIETTMSKNVGVTKKFSSEEINGKRGNYLNAKNTEQKDKAARDLLGTFFRSDSLGLKNSEFFNSENQTFFKPGNNKTRTAMAEILANSDNDGPYKTLLAMKELIKNSPDIENAEQAITELDSAINKLADDSEDIADDVKKNIKTATKANAGSKVLGKFEALKQGAGLALGNFVHSIPSMLVKGLKLGGIGLLAGLGTKLMSSLSKNEEFQKSMTNISEKIGTVFDGLVKSIEPVIEPFTNLIIGLLNWLQPAINWISNILGKAATWFGGKLTKAVSNISDSVATIEGSYKDKDLREMMLAEGVYKQENDMLVAKIGDVIVGIDELVKGQKESNTLQTLTAMNSNGNT